MLTTLLIDDDRAFSAVAAAALQREGMPVTVAHSLFEARQKIAAGSFDFVVLDRRLPDGDVPNLSDRTRPGPGGLASERLERDPRLASDEGTADQDHELGEVPTRDVVVLRGVDREVLAPLWLLVGRAAVGGKDAELG